MPPSKPKPNPNIHIHTPRWKRGHERPRWNIFECSKCFRTWAVHNQDAAGWTAPMSDCKFSTQEQSDKFYGPKAFQ